MRTRAIRQTIGLLFLFIAIAYVACDARLWARAAQTVDVGLRRLGELHNEARLGAIYVDNDSYYWLNYAQRIARGETWRVRHTLTDNPPDGRPVQWSQSVSWLLVSLGKVRQLLTHEEMTVAMERAAVWLNPLLLILLVCVISGLTFRRLGAIPAGLFALYLVTLGDVAWDFHPLRPDHQSLQSVFAMVALVSLILGGAGWVRVGENLTTNNQRDPGLWNIPDPRTARRWFVLSGIWIAFSLWISAIVTSVLLVMLFGGALLVGLTERGSADRAAHIKPELWRWWGWSAGIGSFLFYLLEYFPHHLSIGLEVNGPLYSVAVLAMGEAICQFLKAFTSTAGSKRRALLLAALCTAVVATLPLAILFGPPQWHALRDPQVFRLHSSIKEFLTMRQFFGPRAIFTFFTNVGIIPLFLLLTLVILFSARLPRHAAAGIWLSFVFAAGFLVLACLQIRWMGLYACMNVWLAFVVGGSFWHLFRNRIPATWFPGIAFLLVLVLLAQPAWFGLRRVRALNKMIHGQVVSRQLVRPAMNKRLALAFREHEGPNTRVLCELDFAPALQYFGEGSVVASYYWENIDGLHAAITFFTDTGEYQNARRVAEQRGLTHVIVQQDDQLQSTSYFIAHGKSDPEAARQTLAAQLIGSGFGLPPWLKSTADLDNIGTEVYVYGDAPIEGRCRIYRIAF